MKVAVIGAGPAGLAAAWELKSKGIHTEVFEAHSKPGGCASYFRRPLGPLDQNGGSPAPKALFDAGATVLWSLREGEFFSSLLKKWGLRIADFHAHTEHRFFLNSRSFTLDTRNEEAWIASLQKNFPQDKEFIAKRFPSFFKVAKSINRILYSVPAEPFLSLDSSLKNACLAPEIIAIAKDFLFSPRKFSEVIEPCSKEFKDWANSLLLITLQARAEEVESLYGISALCFLPLGSGSLEGGMASLFDALSQQFPSDHTKIHFRQKIKEIRFNAKYELVTENAVHTGFTHILSSIPRWNTEELFSEKVFDTTENLKWENIKEKLWSAIVGYFVFNDDPTLPDSAFNHLVKTEAGEFYFSVSKRGDLKRAPSQYRVVTASTHDRLKEWNYARYIKKKPFEGREIYEAQKERWKKNFLDASRKVFYSKPLFLEMGTPQTFYGYTYRKNGFVGGIPLTKEFSLLNSPSQETLIPNVFQIGDTSFPGQSVVNCAVGALEAVRKILKSI